MKRLLTMILALLLIGSIALAETIDFASMTDDELNALISGAQAELKSRKGGDEYWYNENGITIYPAGVTKYNDLMRLFEYGVVVENDTDKVITVSCDCVVNGWSVYATGIYDVAAGKTVKDFIDMYVKDVEGVEGVEGEGDIETFDISIEVYDDEYETLAEFGPITVDLK